MATQPSFNFPESSKTSKYNMNRYRHRVGTSGVVCNSHRSAPVLLCFFRLKTRRPVITPSSEVVVGQSGLTPTEDRKKLTAPISKYVGSGYLGLFDKLKHVANINYHCYD